MTEFNFDNFKLFCFSDFTDTDGRRKADKFFRRNDILVSMSKENFIEDLRGITSVRFQYIEYWKEHSSKEIISIYDELINSRIEIEHLVKELNCDTFVVRKNNPED